MENFFFIAAWIIIIINLFSTDKSYKYLYEKIYFIKIILFNAISIYRLLYTDIWQWQTDDIIWNKRDKKLNLLKWGNK